MIDWYKTPETYLTFRTDGLRFQLGSSLKNFPSAIYEKRQGPCPLETVGKFWLWTRNRNGQKKSRHGTGEVFGVFCLKDFRARSLHWIFLTLNIVDRGIERRVDSGFRAVKAIKDWPTCPVEGYPTFTQRECFYSCDWGQFIKVFGVKRRYMHCISKKRSIPSWFTFSYRNRDVIARFVRSKSTNQRHVWHPKKFAIAQRQTHSSGVAAWESSQVSYSLS